MQDYKVEKLPVVDKKGKLKGLITYRDILKLKSHPNACKDQFGRLLVGAAVGVTSDMLDRISALIHNGVDVVCIDTAHGHSHGVLESVKKVKKAFKKLEVIAGNVATKEGAIALAEAGADAVKVGVGPGSICTTRIVTGAGVPQLTAIMEAAKGLKKFTVPLIADGGIRYTGDIVKAIAAGADTVMAGSLFAGVEESPGKPSFLKDASLNLTGEWVLLKPCRKVLKTVISRMRKMISGNWCRKVLWVEFRLKAH